MGEGCCKEKTILLGGIENGWFHEKNTFFKGHTQAIKVEKVLYEGRSKYQDILIFESESHGKVLVLDGAIQCTSFDEYSYQEMITFLPVNSHKSPKSVLVIGGGDGGVLRELVKHDLVETVDICEIDEDVINLSKKYLPEMAVGFASEKVNVYIQDGYEFLKKADSRYDVVIADLSDPDGPSEMLYTEETLTLMKRVLKPDGIACIQGESMWLMRKLIKKLMAASKKHFPVVSYATCYMPTYPAGQIGFLLMSKNGSTDFKKPYEMSFDLAHSLKYYSLEMHRAAFVLPRLFHSEIYGLD